MRRMAVGGVTAAMLLVLLGACGGSEASPSAAASDAATRGAHRSRRLPPVEGPPRARGDGLAPETVRMTAHVRGRRRPQGPQPRTTSSWSASSKGTKVRVVETVTGDPYEAGSCGPSGDEWLKIDRINGKSIKALYGVPVRLRGGWLLRVGPRR